MAKRKPKAEDPAAGRTTGYAGVELPIAVNAVFVHVIADMGTEVLGFVWDRVQKNLKNQQAVLASTSLKDSLNIQTGFLTATWEQYVAEAGRIATLMGKAMVPVFTPQTDERRYDDVPL